MIDNKLITAEPTLTTSSNNTNDESGLYFSTATNTGKPTYYFRGNVENNYVSFAGFTWRIVRINEDGTVRMIMQDGINNNTKYVFNFNYNNYADMYYSNSEAKTTLENWYQTNIGSKSNLADKVTSGNYYCEQAKVKYDVNAVSGNVTMPIYTNYIPDFKCVTDSNNKGIVSADIGLITYDEVVYAGGYSNINNTNYYLYNSSIYFWTMSPSGVVNSASVVWSVSINGNIYNNNVYSIVNNLRHQRPVLNLKSSTQISVGNGTKESPFVI